MMNALLHGIEGNFLQGDTLSEFGKQFSRFDIILSNPPFGTKKGEKEQHGMIWSMLLPISN